MPAQLGPDVIRRALNAIPVGVPGLTPRPELSVAGESSGNRPLGRLRNDPLGDHAPVGVITDDRSVVPGKLTQVQQSVFGVVHPPGAPLLPHPIGRGIHDNGPGGRAVVHRALNEKRHVGHFCPFLALSGYHGGVDIRIEPSPPATK